MHVIVVVNDIGAQFEMDLCTNLHLPHSPVSNEDQELANLRNSAHSHVDTPELTPTSSIQTMGETAHSVGTSSAAAAVRSMKRHGSKGVCHVDDSSQEIRDSSSDLQYELFTPSFDTSAMVSNLSLS